MRVFTTTIPAQTEALGARLGSLARAGQVVSLRGELGAGKTVFARGVGAGIGVHTRVQSPTFVLVHMHEGGRLPFAHADLYRLSEYDELEQLGLDDVLAEGGVVLVEWAERFPEVLPADHLELELVEVPEGRELRGTAHGPRSRELLEAL